VTHIDAKEFPLEITRCCCPGKTCGNVELRLNAEAVIEDDGKISIYYNYLRDNGDEYFYPYRMSLDELKTRLNDPIFFAKEEV
jgi:hypothetical protein